MTKGSRQIRSVPLEEGLALKAAMTDHMVRNIILVSRPFDDFRWRFPDPLREITVTVLVISELVRTRRI